MYDIRLLDYYKNNTFRGSIEKPDFSSGAFNPSCGDRIAFTGRIHQEHLSHIAFESEGCVISQACAAMLCERVQNASLDAIQDLMAQDIKTLLQIDLGPTRLKCALLSLEALQEGLRTMKADNA